MPHKAKTHLQRLKERLPKARPARRKQGTAEHYGRNWQRLRRMKLRRNACCEICEAEGEVTPANEVHHIVPFDKGGTNAMENLQSLCKSCHSSQTSHERLRMGGMYAS